MALVHIDGVPGAGKSTVVQALRAHGYAAIDLDDGLCAWRHKTTRVMRSPETFSGGRGADGYDWVVSRVALDALAELSGDDTVFVAGSIGNRDEDEIAELFVGRFAMSVPVATILARLDAREASAWGHEDEQQRWIPGWHDDFVEGAEQDDRTHLVDVGAMSEDEVVAAVLERFPGDRVDPHWIDELWNAAETAAKGEFAIGDSLDPPTLGW